MKRATVLLPALLFSCATALAQTRPLSTEPATTAPAGALVFETGIDVVAKEPSYVTGVERTRWDGPLLRLVYSPASNVEVDLEWVARVWAAAEPGRAAVSDSGDVTLRAKVRFLDGRGARATVGARFGVTLPETSFNDAAFRPLGLGPNTTRAFAEGLLTQPLGPVRLHANAGLLTFDEPLRPHEQRDFLSYGLALEWPIRRWITALAEVAGRAGHGRPGADERSEARAGARIGSGRVRADAALRRGLAPADGTWGVTVGLAWTLRPARPAPPAGPPPPPPEPSSSVLSPTVGPRRRASR